MEWLNELLTESDNETQDVFRWLAVASVLVGLGLMVYAVVWKSQPFAMMEFGTGIGALLAGVGVALKLKPETKP